MNPTEAAQTVRTALKSELGLGPKDVSVRKSAGGASVHVTIRVLGVSLDGQPSS